jgi:Sulfate permease family
VSEGGAVGEPARREDRWFPGVATARTYQRLGFLAELLSKPVLVGYLAGIAALMVASQLEKVTGIPVDSDTFSDSSARLPCISTPCTCPRLRSAR